MNWARASFSAARVASPFSWTALASQLSAYVICASWTATSREELRVHVDGVAVGLRPGSCAGRSHGHGAEGSGDDGRGDRDPQEPHGQQSCRGAPWASRLPPAQALTRALQPLTDQRVRGTSGSTAKRC